MKIKDGSMVYLRDKMLETSIAECAWIKQEQIFYKGIKIIVIKKKLLGKPAVH